MRTATIESRLVPALAAAIGGAVLAAPALADWPTDPATPLVVGSSEGAFGPRQSAIAAGDGAVWVAWQDSFCGGFDGGAVRLQRIAPDCALLAPGGLETAADETCGFVVPPVLARVGDGALVSRAFASLSLEPAPAFDPTGAAAWPEPYSALDARYLGAASRLPSGATLVVSVLGSTIFADAINADGTRVWDQPAEFDSETGSNLEVFGIVPAGDGGAFIFWDSSSFAYTRLIRAQRVAGDGTVAWPTSVRMVDSPPGVTSSRHTRPVAVPDGEGGAVVVFARGFETGLQPAPLLMQRIDPDGVLAFPLSGSRVSLGTERQFDPIVLPDEATGDLVVVWRDGLFDEPTIRAQRITAGGSRLWGDEGVHVADISPPDGFDATWSGRAISVVRADGDGVVMHTVDTSGQPVGGPATVGVGAATSPRAVDVLGGTVVTWQADPGGQADAIVAQRVNAGGRLGDPGCSPADLAEPVGALDFSDVVAFLNAFGAAAPRADLAEPFGQWDFSDVVGFLALFAAGCP